MDYSPPGSSVHRILQARKLEWGAIYFSRGSPRPRDGTLNYMSIIPEAVLKIKTMKPQRDPASHHQMEKRAAMMDALREGLSGLCGPHLLTPWCGTFSRQGRSREKGKQASHP